MGLRNLYITELNSLQYEQIGMDMIFIDHRDMDGQDYQLHWAEAGTNVSNLEYHDVGGPNPHWIGIHNITTGGETAQIQARSLTGDDFTKNGGVYTPATYAHYIEISEGDIIWGKFDRVAIWQTLSPVYEDSIRLIRGTGDGT